MPPTTHLCSVYALASGPNYFILIPNIAGLGLFGMQLCVYRLYSPFYFVGEERPTAKLIGGRDRTEVDESSFQPSASCSSRSSSRRRTMAAERAAAAQGRSERREPSVCITVLSVSVYPGELMSDL